MRRVALFVDAGYFWVQATYIVHRQRLGRESITIDYLQLRAELIHLAQAQFPDADLLRVYWYDGPGTYGKTAGHQAIEDLDDFKLRLGTRNGVGDQKAVDGLIIADLISLAQSKSITDALLLSGDADLTPGVLAAQSMGIRVHLLTMGPAEATSPFLRAEADCKTHWEDDAVKRFVSAARSSSASGNSQQAMAVVPQAGQFPAEQINLADVAQITFDARSDQEKATIPEKGSLPQEIDRRLLRAGRDAAKRSLEDGEKRQLRAELRKVARNS
ncbi:NYN domain-containing protein [Allochromatium tepidum]|uniref:NYN domain-containing protein n=1 Tax=Allochromatium tepidum TaxID=553982 RepID=A0ABN6GHX4_9GAMM|nr:NYN domain-containing protein [Allochromatium tepidum]BCU07985.1 hypothetical protein Atep_26620 [Allochromatium tepidum]